jgi:hypothetical protein
MAGKWPIAAGTDVDILELVDKVNAHMRCSRVKAVKRALSDVESCRRARGLCW